MTEEIKALAERIKNSDVWNLDDLKELCKYAGLEDEWAEADGSNFDMVLEKAVTILGVEIF